MLFGGEEGETGDGQFFFFLLYAKNKKKTKN
jgi:hypothetical protein